MTVICTITGAVLSAHITMQIVSLLVVLFANVVMLGVPKDHKGPHGAHRNTGLQKSHWCKWPLNNFGPRQNHQTVRHSHSKPHKCNQALHSEYKKRYIT